MTDLRIRYTITEASLSEGLKASTDFVRLGLYVAVGFGAVIGLELSNTVSSWRSLLDVWELLWRSILAGIGFAAAMTALLAFILLPIRARRLFRQNPLIFGEMELESSNSKFTITGPRSSTTYVWDEVHGFKETRRVFVIALSKSVSFAIPKSDMTTTMEDSLRAVLKAHVRRIRFGGLV